MNLLKAVYKINTVCWILCPWVFVIGYPILRLLGIINFHLDWFIWIGISGIGLACSAFTAHITAKYEADDEN